MKQIEVRRENKIKKKRGRTDLAGNYLSDYYSAVSGDFASVSECSGFVF